jgi:RNA ligase (TIGR02306 family)
MNEIDATEVTERDNLSVVAVVDRLEAIPLKDRIELVYLRNLGYTCVCEKGHKVGDLVVFTKYDTIVPKNDLFAFMAESKYRVKSKSFTERDEDDNVVKKIYSQGIVLPAQLVIDFIYEQDCIETNQVADRIILSEGDDVTEGLGVKKYLPPAQNGGGLGNMQTKGDFPINVIAKTDEDNLASRMSALFELEGKAVYFTIKSEGSSCTALVDPVSNEFNVCTRNNMIVENEGSKFWQAVNKYNLKEQLPEKCPNIAVQGELVGSKIQANHHGIDGVDLHVFTMTDILDNRRRLDYNEMGIFAEQLGLTLVKTVYFTNCFNIVPNIENDNWDGKVDENTVWTFDRLQKFADIQVYDNGSLAEGIVIRPCVSFPSQKLRTSHWSGKILSRDYKL